MNHSLSFDKCTQSCSQHHTQYVGQFLHPKMCPGAPPHSVLPPLINHWSFCHNALVFSCTSLLVNGIIHMYSSILASFDQHVLGDSFILLLESIRLPFLLCNFLLAICILICWSIHLLIDIWIVSSAGPGWIKLVWIFMHKSLGFFPL